MLWNESEDDIDIKSVIHVIITKDLLYVSLF